MSPAKHTRADELALLELARDGDEGAFGELIEAHHAELRAYCYRMLGSLQDAEDALQDALLRAWRGLSGFEGRSSVRSWLYTIAGHTALDIARHRSRRELPVTFGPPAPLGAELEGPLNEPVWLEAYPDRWLTGGAATPSDARYEQRESVELAFIVALQQLPPLQRAVLILRDVVGFSPRGKGLGSRTAGRLARSFLAVSACLPTRRNALCHRPYWPVGHRHEHRPDIGD